MIQVTVTAEIITAVATAVASIIAIVKLGFSIRKRKHGEAVMLGHFMQEINEFAEWYRDAKKPVTELSMSFR